MAPPSSDGVAASSSTFPAATQQLVNPTPGQMGTTENPFQQPVDVEKKEEIVKVIRFCLQILSFIQYCDKIIWSNFRKVIFKKFIIRRMILFQVEPEQDTKVAEKKSSTNEKNLSGSAAEVIGKVIFNEF